MGICQVLEKWDRLANTLEVSAKWSSYKSLQADSFITLSVFGLSNSAFNIKQIWRTAHSTLFPPLTGYANQSLVPCA